LLLMVGGSRDIVFVIAARFVSQLHAASAGTSCSHGSWTLVKLSLVSFSKRVRLEQF
jgi:hypothetical protein